MCFRWRFRPRPALLLHNAFSCVVYLNRGLQNSQWEWPRRREFHNSRACILRSWVTQVSATPFLETWSNYLTFFLLWFQVMKRIWSLVTREPRKSTTSLANTNWMPASFMVLIPIWFSKIQKTIITLKSSPRFYNSFANHFVYVSLMNLLLILK